MHVFRAGRRPSQFLALAAVCAGMLVYAGCGGAGEDEVVIPPEPPAEKAKDSMDYYRNEVLK